MCPGKVFVHTIILPKRKSLGDCFLQIFCYSTMAFSFVFRALFCYSPLSYMYSLPIEQIFQHLLWCIDKLLCKLIVLGFLITDGSYAINA